MINSTHAKTYINVNRAKNIAAAIFAGAVVANLVVNVAENVKSKKNN